MLFSNRYYIQLAALNGTSDVLVHNQSNAVAVDFDWQSKCIFWSDVTSRGSSLRKVCGWDKGENRSKITTLATLRNPDGLAVDWVGRNLYWCDKGSDTIEVSNLNGEYRRVIVSEGLLEPRALAVDPTTGFLFWSDWGAKPHIGRAWMDGSRDGVHMTSALRERGAVGKWADSVQIKQGEGKKSQDFAYVIVICTWPPGPRCSSRRGWAGPTPSPSTM